MYTWDKVPHGLCKVDIKTHTSLELQVFVIHLKFLWWYSNQESSKKRIETFKKKKKIGHNYALFSHLLLKCFVDFIWLLRPGAHKALLKCINQDSDINDFQNIRCSLWWNTTKTSGESRAPHWHLCWGLVKGKDKIISVRHLKSCRNICQVFDVFRRELRFFGMAQTDPRSKSSCKSTWIENRVSVQKSL